LDLVKPGPKGAIAGYQCEKMIWSSIYHETVMFRFQNAKRMSIDETMSNMVLIAKGEEWCLRNEWDTTVVWSSRSVPQLSVSSF
jgi:hypothetical protein